MQTWHCFYGQAKEPKLENVSTGGWAPLYASRTQQILYNRVMNYKEQRGTPGRGRLAAGKPVNRELWRKPVSARVSPETFDALTARAKSLNISRAHLIEQFILDGLGHPVPETGPTPDREPCVCAQIDTMCASCIIWGACQ